MTVNIVNSAIILSQGGLDLFEACHPESCTEVDDVALRFFDGTESYTTLIRVESAAAPLEKPRKCVEGLAAIASVVEGASVPMQYISGASQLAAALTSVYAVVTFLAFGILSTAISLMEGGYAIFKACVYQSEINQLKAADTDLLKKEKEILKLRRNEALANIFFAAVIVALFIVANVVTCGIPLLALLAGIIIGACIIKCLNAHRVESKVRILSEQLLFMAPTDIHTDGRAKLKAMIIAGREGRLLNEQVMERLQALNAALDSPAPLRTQPEPFFPVSYIFSPASMLVGIAM